MNVLAALHRMFERRRVVVVERDLLRYHGIDLRQAAPTEPPSVEPRPCEPPCEECRPAVPRETVRIADYMHLQSHDLHVLQFQADKFVRELKGEAAVKGET